MSRALRSLAALAAIGLIGFGLWTGDGVSDARWLALLGVAWVLLLIASRVPLPASMPSFNRTLVRTALVLATVFAVVSAQLVRIQVVQSEATVNRTGVAENGEIVANPRLGNRDLAVQRGRIFDRNGVAIADTERGDGVWIRTYPDPATGYLAGYYSPLLYGTSGLEATYDEELTGQEGNDPLIRLRNDLLNRPQQGLDLHLTLDSELQQAAHEVLDGRNGAVVVTDLKTGAVLVFASNPTYDPNALFTTTPGENDAATAYWESLSAAPDSPLVPRANLGRYTPGSTFKTVSAAIAIDQGFAAPDDLYEDDGDIEIEGRVLVENNRPDPSRTEWTLAEGLAWSLNVVFAQIGLEIGPTLMWEYAQRFGFGAEIPFDLPVAESQVAGSREFLDSLNGLADTAFGQGQVLATPLHMAMLAATYGNDGRMMTPYLVERVATQDGDTVRTAEPRVWREPISAETAADVEEMMINAVQNGSVQAAQVPGYVVGGKTGTAETGGEQPHSWFIGFIGNPEPRYAVAVVLEEGGSGLAGAVGIGRDMLVAAMSAGEPR